MTLYIYDKYPLVDGSFFLSPLRYNSDLQVVFEHRLLYLNAVCMRYVLSRRKEIWLAQLVFVQVINITFCFIYMLARWFRYDPSK